MAEFLFSAVPLLAALPAGLPERLVKQGSLSLRAYRKGQLLHAEGDDCDALEVVLSGLVAVERISQDGDLMRVAEFAAGDCIGGNLLFSGEPVYSLAVTAVAPSHILRLPKPVLLVLMREHEGFLMRYLRDVADNALRLEGAIKHYANLSIRRRLLNYLDAQRIRQGSTRIILPQSKAALAAQLGVARTSLSRVLQQMKREGLLEVDRRSITLLTGACKAPMER